MLINMLSIFGRWKLCWVLSIDMGWTDRHPRVKINVFSHWEKEDSMNILIINYTFCISFKISVEWFLYIRAFSSFKIMSMINDSFILQAILKIKPANYLVEPDHAPEFLLPITLSSLPQQHLPELLVPSLPFVVPHSSSQVNKTSGILYN